MHSTTAAPQQPTSTASTTPIVKENKSPADDGILAKGKKLLGLGKKTSPNTDQKDSHLAEATAPTTSPAPASTLLPSPPRSPRMLLGASPNRRIGRSSSPGLHSPASSLIFERNVQEPEPSADVPAHIKTEDYIPPALDASSLAITDDHLNPDDVEIVMHSAHQPASAAVAGGKPESVHSPPLVHEESTASSHADLSEAAPDYGSLDMTDPRRLSFISFADVVQAEHVEQDRQETLGSSDNLQFMSLSATANRSPSPVRSPVSSYGMSASPPTSGTASPKGVNVDRGRTRSPASPMSPPAGAQSPPLGAELPLQIETMRQALKKSRSGDLNATRSQPLSAVSVEDNDKPPFK